MLTKLNVKNFKRLDNVEVELGNPAVFIGPNNSGKTTALHALALWEAGLKKWNEKRKGKKTPGKRPGVTLNRRDLVSIPIPKANHLWRDLHIRNVKKKDGKQDTQNIRIDIIVEGVSKGKSWKCGFEFDYANEESFYCRPLRISEGKESHRMPVPDEAGTVKLAFLPPMSGLASNETKLDSGAIDVRIGEGRTAEVLRNLCFQIHEDNDKDIWKKLCGHINTLFGAKLDSPRYIEERGEIAMSFKERDVALDISASGRGLQQTLLLLSYMYANKGAVLLLDEPDAHLEILRQRQIYELLTEVTRENKNQIIAASHSEVLLNEAAAKDVVVAFTGKPHRINNQGSELRKALNELGWEQYHEAEQTGWVLYLEGPTDLAILKAFAKKLDFTEAIKALERPFVHHVGNRYQKAFSHFHGLRDALPELQAVAILDRRNQEKITHPIVLCEVWKKREIENYLCQRETLEAYAKTTAQEDSLGDIFTQPEIESRLNAMQTSIDEVEKAMETLQKGSPWDDGTKVSDDFLTPLFKTYYKKLKLPNLMDKKNFHELARYVPKEQIDPEIKEKLESIVKTSKPRESS